MTTATKRIVKKLPVKTLHGTAPLRRAYLGDKRYDETDEMMDTDTTDISLPKFYRPRKDYIPNIIIFILSALFLYFAFTGQLAGETLIP